MIRVAIVNDQALVRAGLIDFLGDEADMHIVGEAANGREALVLACRGDVDVLVMDLNMPGPNGVDALAAIKAQAPDLPVLILSGFPETHYAMALLDQGAAGYLNKECDPAEIVLAIRSVFHGGQFVSDAMTALLRDRQASARLPQQMKLPSDEAAGFRPQDATPELDALRRSNEDH